jgi:hypothetical protein
MNSSVKEVFVADSDTLIVSFGGNLKQFGLIPPFEFLRFLDTHYPDVNKMFIVDQSQNSYHSGLKGITNTIDETTAFLREKIRQYRRVYFLGVSAGGYAAILFGSLLKVTAVIAFIPQTRLSPTRPNTDMAYIDVEPYIHPDTQYYLCADNNPSMSLSDCHHMSHCTRLSNHPNVHITLKTNVHLPDMRNSGELIRMINDCINKGLP